MKPLCQYRNFMIYGDNKEYMVIVAGSKYISSDITDIYTFVDNYLGFYGG